jgi:DNA-binding NarL/FixJ family response regulator
MIKTLIILADHDILLRKFLRMIIQVDPEYVISEAGDGMELLRQLEETTPDVVILDTSMPGLSGLNVVEMIKKQYPQVKIVILTRLQDQNQFRRAIRMGVEGYVLKEEIENVDCIINTVLQGETYISSGIDEAIESLASNS